MAVGFPTKVTYANGDVFSASDINDTNGTINLLTSSTLSRAAAKNATINGGTDIWQRGTSISLAASTSSASAFTTDRWTMPTNASQACTVSRQSVSDTTNLPTLQYCARIQRNSGQTGTGQLNFGQSFETANSIPYAGQAVTLSFYARKGANYSATSNALGVTLITGTGTDQSLFSGYTGSASPISQTATLTATWQRFTYTATLAATITEMGVYFSFSPTGTASTNDYYEITGIQVELGSYATTFSRAGGTIQGELAACQRYYMRLSSAGTSAGYGLGYAYATTSVANQLRNPVTMRTTPSTLDYAVVELTIVGAGNFAITALAIDAGTSGPDYVTLLATGASGLTTYRPYSLKNASSATGYIGLSAEL
jgi:hypothetical protein